MSQAELGLPSEGREPWQASPGKQAGIDIHSQYFFERTGGDLFDTVRVGPRVAFLLSDIAGRRPEVDPISTEMQRAFRASSLALFSAADMNLMESTELLVHAINHALFEAAKGVRFAPTMVGCYDEQLGVLAYINAGGQAALFRDSEGTRVLPNGSVPLGLFSHLPYDASILAFEPGAVLLVVTKGVTERKRRNRTLGPERLIDVLQSAKFESASEVCQAVQKAVQRLERRRWDWLPFRGKPIREDMTALAMVRAV